MRILKKPLKDDRKHIEELELQLVSLLKENELLKSKLNNDFVSFPFNLYTENEGLDILIYNINEDRIHSPANQSFVLPFLPPNLNELKNLFHNEDLSQFENAFEKLDEKNFSKCQIRAVFDKDATKDTKTIEATLVRNPSNTNLVFINLRDISALAKQKKELLKSREKIEESDQLKSTILSNISHHIRTPLNSVTGFAELLANTDFDTHKRKEYIEIIRRQSKYILGFIDDISEIAKLEAGRINISKIPSNLKLILKEILLGINQQRNKKQQEQVEIRLNLPEGKGLELMTDSGRLQQSIINIINYSLRNTQKGYIEFGYNYDEQSQRILFFINDTSGGLSRDEQKVIFNRFSVIDNSERNKLEDPGLGLTIARSIIKSLGGKIWVESEEGKGNSFMFTIPFEAIPETEHVDIEKEVTGEISYQWPNKRILIVDDEEVNAMFLEAVFQGTGAQILFAKNGFEAVELSKNISGIDLILMDIKMPVMNGLKATQEIRKFNSKLPIIAQTALASEDDKHQCLLSGCNDAITKPIEVQELLALINHYLSE